MAFDDTSNERHGSFHRVAEEPRDFHWSSPTCHAKSEHGWAKKLRQCPQHCHIRETVMTVLWQETTAWQTDKCAWKSIGFFKRPHWIIPNSGRYNENWTGFSCSPISFQSARKSACSSGYVEISTGTPSRKIMPFFNCFCLKINKIILWPLKNLVSMQAKVQAYISCLN